MFSRYNKICDIMQNEYILVTGGAGFIGSHVCDKLLDKESSVICLDNFSTYYDPERKRRNIARNLNNKISNKNNFILIEGDICDRGLLEKIFRKYKISEIVHLAAQAGVRYSLENPYLYEKTNVEGTLNLLEEARKNNVKKFIFGSSSSVYGNSKKIPFNEEVIEDKPISIYAATKRAGELLCYTYHKIYGLNITCLRFFTVYGERGRPDMAPYIFVDSIFKGKEIKMFGDGTTKRDYTYVGDITDGIILALNNPLNKLLPFEIINLGNGNPVMLMDFIRLVEKNLGKKANIKKYPIPPGDVDMTYADITKARTILGYNPKTSIEEGIKKFIDWYVKNGENDDEENK